MTHEALIKKEVVLNLLSLGFGPAEIGPALGVSARTAEFHITQLRKDHSAKNVTHLVAIAMRKKIIK